MYSLLLPQCTPSSCIVEMPGSHAQENDPLILWFETPRCHKYKKTHAKMMWVLLTQQYARHIIVHAVLHVCWRSSVSISMLIKVCCLNLPTSAPGRHASACTCGISASCRNSTTCAWSWLFMRRRFPSALIYSRNLGITCDGKVRANATEESSDKQSQDRWKFVHSAAVCLSTTAVHC